MRIFASFTLFAPYALQYPFNPFVLYQCIPSRGQQLGATMAIWELITISKGVPISVSRNACLASACLLR